MDWMEWMGGLIVVGVILFLMWCFDLIGFLNRRMKGKTKGKNGN